MTSPKLSEVFGSNPLGIDPASLTLERESVREHLKGMSDEEIKELSEFMEGRHPPEEWDAFFAYVQLPPWKRKLSRITGILIELVPFYGRRPRHG